MSTTIDEITFTSDDFPFLKNTITLRVKLEDDLWVASHPDLDLTLYALSYDELHEEFASEVEYLVEIILPTPDDELFPQVQKIKAKIPNYIDVKKYWQVIGSRDEKKK